MLAELLTDHTCLLNESFVAGGCVQSVLTYGMETWAMEAENLNGLERMQRMMVRCMCGVSLKDRKRSVDLYSLLGIQSVADSVRRGRLRLFGHLERRNVDDWVSTCRNVEVAGVRCRGRRLGARRLGENV